VDFRILGPVEVRIDDSPLPLEGLKQRITLAALLTVAGDVAPLDRLIDWLWGRRPPRSAATIVQAHVSRLRRLLDPQHRPWGQSEILIRRPPGYQLCIEPDQLDALRFEWFVGRGRAALDRCELEDAARLLNGALALWRGRALADVAFVEAAQVEVVRLEALRMGATTALVDAELALGRHDELIPRLEGLVQEYPFDERLSGQLMIALWRAGRQADSLKVYERVRARLARELRISPSPASQRIAAAILAQDPELGLIGSCAFTGRRS
jgi:DNA-binding SARP family transcriptional activator